MRRATVTCLLSLALAGFIRFHSAQGDEAAPLPQPRPIRTELAPEGAIEVDTVLITLLLVEIRGDVPRAMKEAGFSQTPTGDRYLPQQGRAVDLGESLSAMLRVASQFAQVDVLSRPQVRTISGQPATVQIHSSPTAIPYLARTGPRSFEQRDFAVETPLGITVELTPSLAGDDTIEVSPMAIAMTTLDGREPVAGLDLEIGKPIVSTRSLKTSITLANGAEPVAIALPGPPGREALLFISARGLRATVPPESGQTGKSEVAPPSRPAPDSPAPRRSERSRN